jgi:hypothetical protein
MNYIRRLLAAALQRRILRASLRTAAVVGILLNLVNQGDAIWGDAALSAGHCLMNFLVPFCVSSYSAARNEAGRC